MTETVKIPELRYRGVNPPVLIEILRKSGEYVNTGDVLFTYSFDGAVFEESASFSGTVVSVFLKKGDSAPAGTAVLALTDENEI